jgi:hypothetical protein
MANGVAGDYLFVKVCRERFFDIPQASSQELDDMSWQSGKTLINDFMYLL